MCLCATCHATIASGLFAMVSSWISKPCDPKLQPFSSLPEAWESRLC